MPHCPMKFQYLRGRLSSPALRILDIGCGNNSPTVTKRWFPGCHYAGADIQRYNNSDADMAAIDHSILSGRRLRLRRHSGVELRPGDFESCGRAYCRPCADSAPSSAQSSSREGTSGLRFRRCAVCRCRTRWTRRCNSATIPPTSACLRFARLRIFCWPTGSDVLHAGRSREGFFTTLADIFKLGKRMLKKLFTGKFSGRGMWYILGFEDHVLGQRKTEA